eukprot:9494382-Pyramimonas_sp.AAC.1
MPPTVSKRKSERPLAHNQGTLGVMGRRPPDIHNGPVEAHALPPSDFHGPGHSSPSCSASSAPYHKLSSCTLP